MTTKRVLELMAIVVVAVLLFTAEHYLRGFRVEGPPRWRAIDVVGVLQSGEERTFRISIPDFLRANDVEAAVFAKTEANCRIAEMDSLARAK